MAGTGDGVAIPYRRGVPLMDMEFYQFHPTGLYKLGILLSEAARGEGGILRNSEGEAFAARYAPTLKDLAPRDMVSRFIYQEVKEGRGIDGKDYVHLDLTHLPPEVIDEKLPDVTDFARTYLGVEPKTEPVPIQPTAHYAMGGIPDRSRRPGASRDADGNVIPGLLLRRRDRLRLGPRRQPARHQLAGRPGRLRPPRRPAHARVRARQRLCRRCRPSRSSWPAPRSPICSARPKGERVADIRARAAGRDDGQGLGRPQRRRPDRGASKASRDFARATPRRASTTRARRSTPT